ncbi:MAG: hypothetical protein LUE98_12860 [Tannerellaceae bacterium]|nr:hypothetical protein [Tannerellaceae bacterium]
MKIIVNRDSVCAADDVDSFWTFGICNPEATNCGFVIRYEPNSHTITTSGNPLSLA